MNPADLSLEALVAASTKFAGDVDYLTHSVSAWRQGLDRIIERGQARQYAILSNLESVLAASSELWLACLQATARIWQLLSEPLLAEGDTTDADRTIRGLQALERLVKVRHLIQSVQHETRALIHQPEVEAGGDAALDLSAQIQLDDLWMRLRRP